MVLVDTSVWVDHLRHSNEQLKSLLEQFEVVVHPFVLSELACGGLKNRNQTLSWLQNLPLTQELDTEDILFFIEKNKLMGQGIGWIDAHLLASAKVENFSLWTQDKTFKKIAKQLNLSYI